MRTLTVAAIQATSHNGCSERNLANAERLVERAAARGAQLVVCPEFLRTGYVFDESIWEAGELTEGPTERWLAQLAEAYSITIGAGFLEAEGDQFWNTFSLFGPSGELLGRVRKASLPFFEGWYFRPCTGPKVVETNFGRVAVGICFDVYTSGFLRHVVEVQPDLILMPHSAPTPRLPLVGGAIRRIYHAQLRGTPGSYARALGVPVVLANKVSFQTVVTPIPVLPRLKLSGHYHGYSSIWDAHGVKRGELVDEEDALVAELALDPKAKRQLVPPKHGYFSFGPKLIGPILGPLMRGLAYLGQRAYGQNERRSAVARRITGGDRLDAPTPESHATLR